jgi:hypothetical protein
MKNMSGIDQLKFLKIAPSGLGFNFENISPQIEFGSSQKCAFSAGLEEYRIEYDEK